MDDTEASKDGPFVRWLSANGRSLAVVFAFSLGTLMTAAEVHQAWTANRLAQVEIETTVYFSRIEHRFAMLEVIYDVNCDPDYSQRSSNCFNSQLTACPGTPPCLRRLPPLLLPSIMKKREAARRFAQSVSLLRINSAFGCPCAT